MSHRAAAGAQIVGLFKGWVDGSLPPLNGAHPEELFWFLSKRAHPLINGWLMNKRLAVLTPLSPNQTGVVVIPRERTEHVHDSRSHKDGVTEAGVVELLGQLFALGNPKYAPNPSYANQLIMFDPTYKSVDPAAKGESPCAALQFCGAPFVHLRVETAYWAKPGKVAAFEMTALSK